MGFVVLVNVKIDNQDIPSFTPLQMIYHSGHITGSNAKEENKIRDAFPENPPGSRSRAKEKIQNAEGNEKLSVLKKK